MKDETHGIPIEEFVGLRPKMYSIMYTENNTQIERETAKAVKNSATKRQIQEKQATRSASLKKTDHGFY